MPIKNDVENINITIRKMILFSSGISDFPPHCKLFSVSESFYLKFLEFIIYSTSTCLMYIMSQALESHLNCLDTSIGKTMSCSV